MDPNLLHVLSGPLRATFLRIGDRFVHEIDLTLGDQRIGLLCSQQGGNDQAWPWDPPLQQVVLESLGEQGCRVALGVGMSGHGHWSVAVEPRSQPVFAIRFDWACKISGPADRLLSSYACPADSTWELTPNAGGLATGTQWRLPDNERPIATLVVEQGRFELRSDGGGVQIGPSEDPQSPGTYRWCYTISVDRDTL